MRMYSVLFVSSVLAVGCGKAEETAGADACLVAGNICTVAGMPGVATRGEEGVPALETGLYLVQDLAVGPDGSLFIMDWNNHRIRQLTPDGLISTIVGNGELGDGPEGPALDALLNHPTHVTFDNNGDLWFAAWHNSRIDKVDMGTGALSYEAGTGNRSFLGDGGDPKLADLDLPSSVVFDENDVWYFSDQANQIIRYVENGVINTIAGVPKTAGYADGPGAAAMFNGSVSQSAPPTSRIDYADGYLYVADSGNHVIRRVDVATHEVTTFAGKPGEPGDAVGAADQAQFYSPSDVEVAADGTVYVADTLNSCVKRIKDGQVDVFAGQCGSYGYEGEGVPATQAIVDQPYGIETGPDGTVYIADTYNHVVRAVTP